MAQTRLSIKVKNWNQTQHGGGTGGGGGTAGQPIGLLLALTQAS